MEVRQTKACLVELLRRLLGTLFDRFDRLLILGLGFILSAARGLDDVAALAFALSLSFALHVGGPVGGSFGIL